MTDFRAFLLTSSIGFCVEERLLKQGLSPSCVTKCVIGRIYQTLLETISRTAVTAISELVTSTGQENQSVTGNQLLTLL